MNQGLIPSRYAKALYEFAAEKADDARVYECAKQLAQSFASEPALDKTMSNPFVPKADKVKLIFTASGTDAASDPVMERFAALLSDNNRLDMARDIALAYMRIYRQAHNIRLVSVTSAAPMEPADEERLRRLIASHLNGASMEYHHSVDPELIGGFTVAVDNERLDASVANELKQLRQTLLSK